MNPLYTIRYQFDGDVTGFALIDENGIIAGLYPSFEKAKEEKMRREAGE